MIGGVLGLAVVLTGAYFFMLGGSEGLYLALVLWVVLAPPLFGFAAMCFRETQAGRRIEHFERDGSCVRCHEPWPCATECDRGRHKNNTLQPMAVTEAPIPLTEMQTIVSKYRDSFTGPKEDLGGREVPIYFQPDIPPEKLDNAVGKYAWGVSSEDAVLLVDTSLRGNGKTGLIVTPTMLFAHDTGLQTTELRLSDVDEVEVKWLIHVNGAPLIGNAFGDAGGAFVEMMRELADTAREVSPVPPPESAGS